MGRRKKVELTGGTLGERLRMFIKSKGLTIKEFSEICGLSDKSVINYVTNQRQPNAEALKKIIEKFPDLDLRWLLLGEGAGKKEEWIGREKELIKKTGDVFIEKEKERQEKEEFFEDIKIIEKIMNYPEKERFVYLMKELAGKYGMEIIFSDAFVQKVKEGKKILKSLKDVILAYEEIKNFFEKISQP